MNQMFFTSIKKNNNQNIPSVSTTVVVQPAVITRMGTFPTRPAIQQEVLPIVLSNNPVEKKMKWGPPIWFLFHTIAEKVKIEDFSSIRGDIINNIVLICKNLPCPNCASHATDYMGKINFNLIQTKDDLKQLLFSFHNEVNKRKGYAIFTREELDDKYSKAITVNIINNFLLTFQDKHKSIRMISDDMYRQRLSVNLKTWFSENINKFNM